MGVGKMKRETPITNEFLDEIAEEINQLFEGQWSEREVKAGNNKNGVNIKKDR